MLFNSIDFLIFFPIVTLLYFAIPRKARYLWLLLASYYFYMCWNPKHAVLLAMSTGITWICGLLIPRANKGWIKRTVVAGGVCTNLAMLFFFKYFTFFRQICNRIFSALHIQTWDRQFDILLPVGISFFIFQALGYLIDVYRGKIEAEKNPLRYALFVSFFPQLVAGPIERSENLLGQLKNLDKERLFNYQNVVDGLILMVWGLFIKMVIADRTAILVNTVFENYHVYGTVALAAGAIGFALQIYCDFMGYSTIAVGAAKVMGFTLMENFETPYFAKSVGEFWRRWHISLSTWFRDYLYIPLGGNRCSRLRKYGNVMLTMTLSGLWHGANWTFVAWGLLHGGYQVVGDLTKKWRKNIYSAVHVKTESFSFRLAQGISTFLLVDVAWIFFRAPGISDALEYCRRMVVKWDPWSFFDGTLYTLGLDRPEMNILAAAVVILLLVDILRYKKKMDLAGFLQEQCIWFRWLVIFALIIAVLVYGVYGINFESQQFIYFQF